MNLNTNKTAEPVVVERTFNAPVKEVWKALVNAQDIKQWSFDIKEFRAEVGFEFQFDGSKDDIKYRHHCKITQVITERKLAYTWRYEGYEGNSLVTIELFEEGPQTRLKLTHEGLETLSAVADFDKKNFMAGWTMIIGESLRHFVEKNIFTISRVFNAPRGLLWKACTEPERMAQWWGPRGLTPHAAKMDFRAGGSYHYGMKTPDGSIMWGKFVYRQIIKPERIVFVNSFSDEQGGLTRHPMSPAWPLETLSVFTFTEQGDKTVLTIQWTPLNATEQEIKTFKEGMAGMTQGWAGTLDQLAAYLNLFQQNE